MNARTELLQARQEYAQLAQERARDQAVANALIDDLREKVAVAEARLDESRRSIAILTGKADTG